MTQTELALQLWQRGETLARISAQLAAPPRKVYNYLYEIAQNGVQLSRPLPSSRPPFGGSWRKVELLDALRRGEALTAREVQLRYGYSSRKSAVQTLKTIAQQGDDGRWRLSAHTTTSSI